MTEAIRLLPSQLTEDYLPPQASLRLSGRMLFLQLEIQTWNLFISYFEGVMFIQGEAVCLTLSTSLWLTAQAEHVTLLYFFFSFISCSLLYLLPFKKINKTSFKGKVHPQKPKSILFSFRLTVQNEAWI